MSKTDKTRDKNPLHGHILTNFSGFKLLWQAQSFYPEDQIPLGCHSISAWLPITICDTQHKRSKSAWVRLKLIHPLRITPFWWHFVMNMATSWVWRRSNICNMLCYWKWDFPSRIEKASADNKTKLFIIFFPCSCLVLLMPEAALFLPSLIPFSSACLFRFLSRALIQSCLNLLFLSTGAGTGQGQENDTIRSFSGQIRRAATCTQTQGNDKWKVFTKGVNMIHGSFVGISPTHIHMNVHTRSQLYLYSRNSLFCQHISS